MDILLVIRGLASLSVVFWHTQGYLGELPSIINMPGRTAVWIFFGISGYVVSYGFIHKRYPLSPSGLRYFYTNRFLRIYPLFIFISALSWFTVFMQTGGVAVDFKEIPSQLFAFQFNHNYVLNGVFWTLGIEIQFYLLAPILVRPLLVKEYKIAIFNGVIMYILLVIALIQLGWHLDGRNVISNLQHFIIGIIGCRVVAQQSYSQLYLPTIILISIACLLLGFTNLLYHNYPTKYWSVGMITVDLVVLLLIFSHSNLEKVNIKPRYKYIYKAFTFIGTLAYGIYAIHGYLLKNFPLVFKDTLTLVISSVLLAYMTYRLIELPALKLKRYTKKY